MIWSLIAQVVLPTGSVDNSRRPSKPPQLEVINSSSRLKMRVCRDFGVPIEPYLRPDPHGRELSTLPRISTAETATVLSHRQGQDLARTALRAVQASRLPVIHIDENLQTH